jgi:hypothetical protein
MGDRTLVEYVEQRQEFAPLFVLAVERLSSGAPGGIVSIRRTDIKMGDQEEVSVIMDDLRRLQPALDWANGIVPGEARPRVLIGWDNLEALHRLLWTALLPNNDYDIQVRLRGERMLALIGQAIGWPSGPPSAASLIVV